MNEVDKISRDAKTLIESTKDTFASNITNAVLAKKLSFDEKQLQTIIAVANLSIDEGYQKALPTFQKTVKRTLSESTLNVDKKKKL